MNTNKANALTCILINTMVCSINHQTEIEIKITLYCVIVIKIPKTIASTCTFVCSSLNEKIISKNQVKSNINKRVYSSRYISINDELKYREYEK